MNSIDDIECWNKYPQHRFLFNKLFLSLKLGYDCGPACVPVTVSGDYVIRPIVNLYGMGVGASICFIDVDEKDYIINHGIIPPGHFWCEYFDGSHYSIDYIRKNNQWEQHHTMIGVNSKNNLTKFTEWTIVGNNDPYKDLPSFVKDISDLEYLNVEFKGDKIIEIHPRTGNDEFYKFSIGTKIIPLWKGNEDMIDQTFLANEEPEKIYNASGYLKDRDTRIGYIVRET